MYRLRRYLGCRGDHELKDALTLLDIINWNTVILLNLSLVIWKELDAHDHPCYKFFASYVWLFLNISCTLCFPKTYFNDILIPFLCFSIFFTNHTSKFVLSSFSGLTLVCRNIKERFFSSPWLSINVMATFHFEIIMIRCWVHIFPWLFCCCYFYSALKDAS